jgi:hypothetical protein
MAIFLMNLDKEICDYLTDKYGFRKSWRDPEIVPIQKFWSVQDHWQMLPEDLAEILIDVFTKYGVDYSKFDMLNYYEAERAFWQRKPPKRDLKPLTVEMIIEAVKAKRWFYD